MSSATGRLAKADRDDPRSWVEGNWYRQEEVRTDGVGSPASAIAFPLAQVYDEAEALLLSKHNDYGPKNIANAPFGPLFGLLVRMHDKQARAVHLVSSDEAPNHESLEDTFMDLLNYSAIAILVLRGQWPGVKA